jgi:hypothetical protein
MDERGLLKMACECVGSRKVVQVLEYSEAGVGVGGHIDDTNLLACG